MSAPASAAPQSDPRRDNSRVIRSPTGPDLHTEHWQIEAVYRMMRNNLDPDVAEKPAELVVYCRIGHAARHRSEERRVRSVYDCTFRSRLSQFLYNTTPTIKTNSN